MSRVINLAMTEPAVRAHCQDNSVAVSALEVLPKGGVRLVCCSSADAARTRELLKKKIMPDDTGRTAIRPRTPLW